MDELIEDIFLIETKGSNSFVVKNTDHLILVDTGMDLKAKKLLGELHEILKSTDLPLKKVLITHHHLDHVRGLASIEKKYHPQIYAHKLEHPMILGEKPMEAGNSIFSPIVVLAMKFMKYIPPSKVQDYEKESFGFKVLNTPGHTDGHLSIYHENSKSLLLGDLFTFTGNFKKIRPSPKIFTKNPSQNKENIRKLFYMMKNGEISIQNVLPSHKKPLIEVDQSYFMDLINKEFGYTL